MEVIINGVKYQPVKETVTLEKFLYQVNGDINDIKNLSGTEA